ncbi:MAG: putative cadmium-transporting ATPase [Promethearchaeota archaeon]|nr:MAG: putative cadmium-transporting ATPase [Candidatus Lokiarchaeota archaeon]
MKGNRFLEKISDIEVFAFDKTGTLTEGKLRVFQIFNYDIESKEVLSIASSLEMLSEHPIGQAIVSYSKKLEIPTKNVNNFTIVKGKGIKGEIDNKLYYVGSQNYFEGLKYELPETDLQSVLQEGTIPIFVGIEGKLLGIITIRDVLRISAPLLIEGLKKYDYNSVLVSGDNQMVCNTIGECLDITNVFGELLPDQKLHKIEELKQTHKGVAMVGDGINDAPALALSDLSIAIGASATDITLETADVIIMGDDLTKLLTFIELAKKTNKVIKQNIWTSIIVKLLFAFLTVIGLMTL